MESNSYLENRFCVYGHVLDGVVRYVGEGTLKRAYQSSRSSQKNWQNTFNDKDFEVVIFEQGLTKEESCRIELEYIKKYADTIINKITNSLRPIPIDYAEVSASVYYDETSPTFLRWVTGNKKYKAGDIAGHISKRESGYVDVTINDRLYRAHRVIWVLFNKTLTPDETIDHISGDRADNRIINLRAVSSRENNRNRLLTPASTGLRNIREVFAGTGLSSFEVVWTNNEIRSQQSFNIRKLGGIENALKSAYAFRDELILAGELPDRLKDGEPSLDAVIGRLTEYKLSAKVGELKRLPKTGLRFIDAKLYRGCFYGLTVRWSSCSKITSKMFVMKNGLENCIDAAYSFRDSLIASGIHNENIKDGEYSKEDAINLIKQNFKVVGD